jgi:hypothetical protein
MKIKTRKFKNRELIKLIKLATNFYADILLPKQKHKIHLDISAKDINADGFCTCLSTYDFEIEIHKDLTFEHMMITLAHEMVHLKQYATKQLKSKFVRGTPVDTWKGTKYRNLKYKEQPWEKEATLLEESLYQQFMFFGLIHGMLDFDKIRQIDLS